MQTFSVKDNGFHGMLYTPETDRFSGKAMILFGGSDGRFTLTCVVAEHFQNAGMTILALAYWNGPDLPSKLRAVPVEAVERAACWLKERGYEKVGAWGISKGGELALLAGSLIPDLISCVVAVCPMDMVCQGIDPARKRPLDGSTWTWRGKELPYAPFDWSMGQIVRDTLRRRELTLRSVYEASAVHAPEKALIPVERIRGPILLLSAKNDSMWPSAEASVRAMARLDWANFPYAHSHISYEYASHLLVPVRLRADKMFAIQRRWPEKCWDSRKDSFQKTLDFIAAW